MNKNLLPVVLGTLTIFATGAVAAETAKNMIADGGVEVVREVMAMDFATSLKGGWDFGDEPVITLPEFFDQLSGEAGQILVVEGKPGTTVHQGAKALFIKGKASGFYLRVTPRNAQKGNKYQMKFWAKGEGKISVNLVSFDGTTGRACGGQQKETPITQEWKEYTLDFEVESPDATDIGPAIYASGQAWIDDLSFEKQ